MPVVSWAVLRGRSRCCAEPISMFYPATETATALCWTAAALFVVPFWLSAAMSATAAVTVFAVALRYQRRGL